MAPAIRQPLSTLGRSLTNSACELACFSEQINAMYFQSKQQLTSNRYHVAQANQEHQANREEATITTM